MSRGGELGCGSGAGSTRSASGSGSFASDTGADTELVIASRGEVGSGGLGSSAVFLTRDGKGDFAVSSLFGFESIDELEVGSGRGGHSRFSLMSSLAESPVLWLTTLAVRVSKGEDVEPESDVRLVCCSNRPMRLATL